VVGSTLLHHGDGGGRLHCNWAELWRALSATAARLATSAATHRPRVLQLAAQLVNLLNLCLLQVRARFRASVVCTSVVAAGSLRINTQVIREAHHHAASPPGEDHSPETG
jgi:hypothetical protein